MVEDNVFVKLNVISFDEMMREVIIIAFQLKQGMIMKEKYIKDSINGVMVVKRENSM